jgi:hypothetical protein
MPPAEFEPAIPAGEPPQTQVLDRAAIGIGTYYIYPSDQYKHKPTGQKNVSRPEFRFVTSLEGRTSQKVWTLNLTITNNSG